MNAGIHRLDVRQYVTALSHPTFDFYIEEKIDSVQSCPESRKIWRKPENDMDGTAPEPNGSHLRQPKKRFVGRRTADAQAQKDVPHVETKSVQRGMPLPEDTHMQTERKRERERGRD